MGCDIHLHIEVKVDGAWHHYANLSPDRSYMVFGEMVGVRSEGRGMVPVRGLPPDATLLTKYHGAVWSGDGHHYSWMNSEEVGRLSDWYELAHKNSSDYRDRHFEGWVGTYLFGSGFKKGWDEEYDLSWVEDFRFIFWFDN